MFLIYFLITKSLWEEKYTNLLGFLSSFYSKRLIKILPAIFFYVLITSLVILLFIPEPRYELTTGLSSLIGISNIYLAKNSFDYFGDLSILNPFINTWSLGVALQFYLIVPNFQYLKILYNF